MRGRKVLSRLFFRFYLLLINLMSIFPSRFLSILRTGGKYSWRRKKRTLTCEEGEATRSESPIEQQGWERESIAHAHTKRIARAITVDIVAASRTPETQFPPLVARRKKCVCACRSDPIRSGYQSRGMGSWDVSCWSDERTKQVRDLTAFTLV